MTTKTTAVSVAVESPVGQLTLVADDAALLALLFEGEREATRGLTARVRLDVDVAEPPLAMPTPPSRTSAAPPAHTSSPPPSNSSPPAEKIND